MWIAHNSRRGRWSISFEGQIQPFGAIFWNSTGDVGKLVLRACKRLNKGETTVQGASGWHKVEMQPDGIANITALPNCNKCQVPMAIGKALQNQAVAHGGFHRGATISNSGPPLQVDVWKCPECGHSFTK